jgi:hypothetical protein
MQIQKFKTASYIISNGDIQKELGKPNLEVENLGLRRHIDEMRPTVQLHIGKKIGLIELAVFGAWRADASFDFIVDQVRQIVLRAVTRGGFDGQVACFVGPGDPAIDKEQIDLMPFTMGDFRKLETSGGGLVVILAQYKQEFCHGVLLDLSGFPGRIYRLPTKRPIPLRVRLR